MSFSRRCGSGPRTQSLSDLGFVDFLSSRHICANELAKTAKCRQGHKVCPKTAPVSFVQGHICAN